MGDRFAGVLPFASRCVQLHGSREEIIGVLERSMIPVFAVRYNFPVHGCARQMLGCIKEDDVHITIAGTGWNSGQVVLHGRIHEENELTCQWTYRLLPNNFMLLFDGLALCICVRFLLSMTKTNYWIWAIPVIVAAFSCFLSAMSAVYFNMCMNESMKEYLKDE